MDGAEILVYGLTLVFSLGCLALFGILLLWAVKFVLDVPKHLKSIADSLAKIANQKGEH